MNKTNVFEAKIKPLIDQVMQVCELYEIPAVVAFAVPVQEGVHEVQVAAFPEAGRNMPVPFIDALTALAAGDGAAHAEIDKRYGSNAGCDGNCAACNDGVNQSEAGPDKSAAQKLTESLIAQMQAQAQAEAGVGAVTAEVPKSKLPTLADLEHMNKRLDTLKGLTKSLHEALTLGR